MKKDREKGLKWLKYFKIQWLVPFFVIGLELLFHLEIYGHFDFNMVHATLFSLPFSFFTLLLGGTGCKAWNGIARCGMLLAAGIYFTAQIIYYQVFGNFLSLKSIANGAGQVMDFRTTIWEAFLQHVLAIGVVVFCLAGYTVAEVISYKREKRRIIEKEHADTKGETGEKTATGKKAVIYLAVIFLLPFLGTIVLMWEGTGFGSAYDVKTSFHRAEQSMYRLGLMETLAKDIRERFCDVAGITENQANVCYLWIEGKLLETDVEEGKPIAESDNYDAAGEMEGEIPEDNVKEEQLYQTWDIDFDTLMENTADEELKEMHAYFSQVEPTARNEYTGMFEGYNLIYITAESFSDVVIDEERTPVLYRMREEGFQFENFYTPSWYLSTIDGEYVNCLGQIPVEGDWSLEHAAENALPMALGNQLSEQGYTCNAYHNHDSYYYDRTKTHPELGYAFKAVGAGLTFQSMYPESDLELMELTSKEYIAQAPFHTYYMTMSGHLPYTYGYNSMAVKNRQVIEGMGLSENAECYLAANTELEYGVEYLIEEIEKADQLDNTLFVIAPDHYPYGLKKGAYDELKGHAVEEDAFEIYRNTCLIWSASMEKMEAVDFPVKVEKYGSNLDLLPTISNLMGLSYDSRLLAGRDLLSGDMGIVMFKDHSFLTDKVRYHATTGEEVWAEQAEKDEAYLEDCMQIVQERFYYSAQILNKNYLEVIKSNGTN